jgi:hypothetical protein
MNNTFYYLLQEDITFYQASRIPLDIGGKMQNAVIFDTIWRKFSPHYTELPVQLELFRAGSRDFP